MYSLPPAPPKLETSAVGDQRRAEADTLDALVRVVVPAQAPHPNPIKAQHQRTRQAGMPVDLKAKISSNVPNSLL